MHQRKQGAQSLHCAWLRADLVHTQSLSATAVVWDPLSLLHFSCIHDLPSASDVRIVTPNARQNDCYFNAARRHSRPAAGCWSVGSHRGQDGQNSVVRSSFQWAYWSNTAPCQ